ncbi:hypothetical protein FRB90_003165, partial [Tulasnella sp. 427]
MTSYPAGYLKGLLSAASIISGAGDKSKKKLGSNVSDVLKSRLLEFAQSPGGVDFLNRQGSEVDSYVQLLSGSQVEESTGDASVWILDQLNETLLREPESSTPSIGLRDLGTLKTLAAIAFRWAINPRLDRIIKNWGVLSSEPGRVPSSAVVEVEDPEDMKVVYNSLLEKAQTHLRLVLGMDKPHIAPYRPLAFLIIPQHVTALLKVCIAFAWGPDNSGSTDMKNAVHSVLDTIPTSQAIASLGAILPQYSLVSLRSACGQLLSEQLSKPEGVRGLFSAVLGDDPSSGEAVPLAKLEHISRVLASVPSFMNAEDYYRTIFPRLLSVLTDSQDSRIQTPAPQSHKRAAAFAIARILAMRTNLVSKILADILHPPFTPPKPLASPRSAISSLQTLQALFSHSDPSPSLPAHVLGPILSPLYALVATLEEVKTSDPALKELVKGLVRLWGRTVDTADAVKGWWKVAESGDGWGKDVQAYWEVGLDDAVIKAGPKPTPISLRATIDIESILDGDEEEGGLLLKPNPKHFAEVLKSLDRKEVASALLVRALDQYQALQAADNNPLKTLFYLRIVMEMVDQLGSTVLSDPQHVLSFVSHSIRSARETYDEGLVVPKRKERGKASRHGMAALRIVGDDDDEEVEVTENKDDGDSDDEGPEDLLSTALNLLLATLEANEKMTPLNTPLLQVILADLEPLTLHSSTSIRPLAREARLVLTVRNASTSTAQNSRTLAADDPKRESYETYQQALKLLQDPILPVRAHGLVLLRQLIVPQKGKPARPLDPALIPAILSIFLQSVQEDDSYIFLNAVQGLVVMVDRLGRDIMKGLMEVYAGGLLDGRPNSGMSKAELDKRVRAGEALNQSIVKCGSALGLYVDVLVPPLFHVVRLRDVPTSLRSSALSLLAQCAATSPPALTPWAADLCSGMLELLQLEGVSSGAPEPRKAGVQASDGTAAPESEGSTARAKQQTLNVVDRMDSEPLSVDSKLAPFRRSAVHFLATLLRTTVQQILDDQRPAETTVTLDARNFRTRPSDSQKVGPEGEAIFYVELIRRMRLVLGY